jgi:hypothetical protein
MTGAFERWKVFVARRHWIDGNCHRSVFACLCRAVSFGIPLCNELIDEIDAYVIPVKGHGYWQPEIEYENAIRTISGDLTPRERQIRKVTDQRRHKQRQWPEANRTQIERVCAPGFKKRAPLHWEFSNVKPTKIVGEIFKPTEFICIATKFVNSSTDKAWFDIQTTCADSMLEGSLRGRRTLSRTHLMPRLASPKAGSRRPSQTARF